MICPACHAKNKQAQVYSLGKTFTDRGFVPSGPDDGIPHLHDPNSSTESFECNNGHRFRVETFVRCTRCDHGHGEPITVMLTPRARFQPQR